MGNSWPYLQFSHSVVSDFLGPQGLQHARLSCPSPILGAYSKSSIESGMPSNHLILCRPLLFAPSIFPSVRVSSNESVLCSRWPKYWSFSFSISASNEYSELISFQFSSVQSLSRVRLFATPWITARLASVHHQLPESTQTHVHGVGDDIQPSHPLLSPSRLPPILPSIGVFSNESTLHMRWPKYWSFSFNIRPSNEHPGLISFRMDWLDLLAVQGTLKHLLQHHSSKASILQHSDFLTIQLSHPHSHHTSLLLNQYKSSDNFIL